ncbi:glycogen debranching protein [Permianibacter sp. IMCC34836]|uniref:amylo-alpha-1,6-glucosidase n=1 Tax=Permianibacter fluminis TaxID=2738515 RepID=UPI001553F6C5|nr:amylo-alpha-1,6-glucosidase [Permianibacter fluminis]NQD37505.1 glycogen debranching protein [Permianibacter fluminis]
MGADRQQSLADDVPATTADPAGFFPDENHFFDTIAIPVSGHQQAQYVLGDNLAGYYEGYTHAFRRGVGYQMQDRTLFHGHASFVNGVLLDRTRDAERDVVLPFGHRAEYAGTTESLLLHRKQHALSLRITRSAPALLGCMPLWDLSGADYVLEQQDEVLLLLPKHQPDGALASSGMNAIPTVIALSASSPFRVEPDWKASTSTRQILSLDQASLAPRMVSTEPVTQFTVHVAFGFSREEAVQKARALAQADSWRAELGSVYRDLTRSQLWTSDAEYNRALVWAKASASAFVVEQFGHGIWAGLPWFRDNWGRDTFIALPGTLLVAGRFDEAKAVLDNFARLQLRGDLSEPNYGRIPNRVAAGQPAIYNTVDGTPWLIREALEYARYSGDEAFAETMLPLIRDYVKGVEAHWLDGNGLLQHDDADTWMDARIANQQAWSPRGNRAVEIQALWFTALEAGATLARRAGLADEAARYAAMAARVQQQFPRLFWDGERMADRVRPDDSRDLSLRPNQLLLVSIPDSAFIPEPMQARVIRNAVSGLLYPYGIASLDPQHANFHPRHENPAFHHKDAAYHNGTIWGWNAGFTVTALNKFGYQDLAWQLSRNLTDQILYLGTRGSMSELLDAVPDAAGKLHPSGTYAQSWSVAEFARNGYQDYLGFRPDLLNGVLAFVPALPTSWQSLAARLPFGRDESVTVRVEQSAADQRWRFYPAAKSDRLLRLDLLATDRSRQRVEFSLTGQPRQLDWDGKIASLDGEPVMTTPIMASQADILGELKMATPRGYEPKQFPVLRGKDVLQQLILKGKQP